jgi:cytochrome c5
MTDREFFKMFSGLLAALVALAVVIYVLAQMVVGGSNLKKIKTVAVDNTLAERIKPVGEVTVATQVMDSLIPTANAAGDKGKATYDASCAACHAAGVAGAPKFGDKAAWKDRIAKGNDALYTNSLKGFQGKAGFMPAKGGNAALADADVKAAVDHMVKAAK